MLSPPSAIPNQFVTEDCHLSEFFTKKKKKEKTNSICIFWQLRENEKEKKHPHDSNKFKRKMRLSLITKIYWNQKCRPGWHVKRIGGVRRQGLGYKNRLCRIGWQRTGSRVLLIDTWPNDQAAKMVISIKTLRTIFVEKNSFFAFSAAFLLNSFEPVVSNESTGRKVFDFNAYKLALINFQCFFLFSCVRCPENRKTWIRFVFSFSSLANWNILRKP